MGERWMVRAMKVVFKEEFTFRYISLPWSHAESEHPFVGPVFSLLPLLNPTVLIYVSVF